MILLIIEPPSSKTSSIVFFLIYIWITIIWLSIATTIVLTFSIEESTYLSMVALPTFQIFSNFNFCQRYFFSLRAILNNCPKFKV